MRREREVYPTVTNGLRDAMRRGPRLRAVIRSEKERIVIIFSDGRETNLPHVAYLAADRLIVAALQWCQRHGADVVEIAL